MKNNIENGNKNKKAEDLIQKNIEEILKRSEIEGGNIEKREYLTKELGISTEHPTLDEQDGNYGDDENPEEEYIKEEDENEEIIKKGINKEGDDNE